MTNFEVIVKNNPELIKEVLAHNISTGDLKDAVKSIKQHYNWYDNTITHDKPEMDFLNAEYKADVLDDIEKNYLSNIIRPFRNKVEYISKERGSIDRYYIMIKLQNDCVCLPCFRRKTGMYKGMDAKTKYTLEELDL